MQGLRLASRINRLWRQLSAFGRTSWTRPEVEDDDPAVIMQTLIDCAWVLHTTLLDYAPFSAADAERELNIHALEEIVTGLRAARETRQSVRA